MTLYVWGSNSDFWSSRTEWTPNGTPNAVTDEAEFTTPGSYTVTVDPSQEYLLDALVLDDPEAELDVQGTLRFAGVDNTLALDAGTLLVDSGGVIQGATIESDGGSLAIDNGSFVAVTYQGELDIPDSATLETLGGLTVQTAAGAPGGTIVLGNSSTLNIYSGLTVGTAASLGSIELEDDSSSLVFNDSETLDDVAVTLGGSGNSIIDAGFFFAKRAGAVPDTLTFGTDATVTVSGGGERLYGSFINAGSLGVTGGTTYGYNYGNGDDSFENLGSLGVSNATFQVNQTSFDNDGSLTVSSGEVDVESSTFTNEGDIDVGAGGTLYISANTSLTNTGSLTVEDGGTLDLQYPLTLTQLENSGITVAAGGVLEISGSLDLGGGILDIAATGLFSDVVLTNGGTIANGTITANDGGTFTLASNATFDGITYQGELDIPDEVTLYTVDGLIVETAAGAPGGTIVFGYQSTLNVTGGLTVGTAGNPGSIELGNYNDVLRFGDSETLDDAAVTVSGNDDYIEPYYYTLTLGADTTVDLSGSQDYLSDKIVNLGSIGVTAGYTYTQNYNTSSSTFDNQGSLSVINGALYIDNSTFTNEGSIDVGDGGFLEIDTAKFTNTGSLSVESGGTLDLQTNLTLAQLDSSGITVDAGGTLEISGSLDLGGRILDIAATGLFGDVVLSGTIANGTIVPDGGTLTLDTAATLDGITYQGELDIPDEVTLYTLDGLTVETAAGAPGGAIVFGYQSTLNVTGGLTVGTAGNPGSIELGNYNDVLRFGDSETLDDAVVSISGYYDWIQPYSNTLTLGADTTVDLSGSQDYLSDNIVNLGSIGVTAGSTYTQNYNTSSSTFDNQGSLSVTDATLYVTNSTFSNEGQITVGDGGLLEIDTSTFTNAGSLSVESGGTLDLQTDLTLAELDSSGINVDAGGMLEISGSLDLGGGILDIAATGLFSNLVLTSGGTIANGTIVADGGTLTLDSGATFDGITYQGELDIPEYVTLYTLDGLTVETATGAPGGTIVFGYDSTLRG